MGDLRGTARLRCLCFLAALSPQPLPAAEASGDATSMHRDAISLSKDALTFAKTSLVFAKTAVSFPTTLEAHETSSTIEVTLAADVLFDFDKSEIRTAAASPLHDLAEMIRSKAHGPVGIRGYTDGLGGDAYNQRLSERRAASVKTWLVAHERLPGPSFTTAGFGAHDPVAANRHPDGSDDPDGRQLNRRVTVVIRK